MTFQSCSKPSDSQVNFKVEKFQPQSIEQIKSLVQDFRNALPSLNNPTLRNNYQDTEVNQGLWILEATSNSIYNQNLQTHLIDEENLYNMEIENLIKF